MLFKMSHVSCQGINRKDPGYNQSCKEWSTSWKAQRVYLAPYDFTQLFVEKAVEEMESFLVF
jgi:hypothetical protein